MNAHETKCPHCEAILAKVNLKRHIRTVHEKQKDHKCDLCGKEYFAKKRLNEHIKRDHDKIRDEKCNQCGKNFFTKDILKKHIGYTHNKDGNQRDHNKQIAKFFECEFCGKSFTKNGIQKHIKTVHEGSKVKFCQTLPPLEDTILSLASPSAVSLSFGNLESSVTLTDTKEKPILGELNFIPQRNSEDENYQIEENCIKINDDASDFEESSIEDKINPSEVQTISSQVRVEQKTKTLVPIEIPEQEHNNDKEEKSNEQNQSDEATGMEYSNFDTELIEKSFPNEISIKDFTGNFENQNMENEDFKNSNITRIDVLNGSKIKFEEKDIDYDNYYDAYSNDINEKNEDFKTDEIFLEEMDIGEEFEESDKIKQSNMEDSRNINDENGDSETDEKVLEVKQSKTHAAPDQQETNGIEIRIEENEVIKNRYGQVVDKKIKCNYCDKICIGKWAVKGIKTHYRLVHEAPNLKGAKNKITKEHLKIDDTSIQNCKICDKSYTGQTALKNLKFHMKKSHSGLHHKCHICDKDFLHKLGNLVWHLQIKHGCRNICEKCEYIYHIAFTQITNYFCLYIGGKAFLSKEFLKIHFDGKHYDERIKARDGIFECNICNRELKSYGHAERHMKLFHPSEESKCLNFEDSEVIIFNFKVILTEFLIIF